MNRAALKYQTHETYLSPEVFTQHDAARLALFGLFCERFGNQNPLNDRRHIEVLIGADTMAGLAQTIREGDSLDYELRVSKTGQVLFDTREINECEQNIPLAPPEILPKLLNDYKGKIENFQALVAQCEPAEKAID